MKRTKRIISILLSLSFVVALQNREKFKWRSATILGGLMHKAAICEGVSKLMKMLLNALDIECIVAIGKSNDLSGTSKLQAVDHAWNIVKIDEKWYHTDVTFDMGVSRKNFVRHDYFNMTDEQISRDHFLKINIQSAPKRKIIILLKTN